MDQTKLEAINAEAPKGMVQIARYFGTEFLRPELEKARDRMVNLVSLHLEYSSGGDLRGRLSLLRDHSFLSRSKAGSDMLKALIAMPQNSHFGMHEQADLPRAHSAAGQVEPAPPADYQAELAQRSQVADCGGRRHLVRRPLGRDSSRIWKKRAKMPKRSSAPALLAQ
jgi:hypothetical protein